MGLAAARGQLVGSVLMQLDLLGLGWRAVFLINVPIGLAALLLAPRLVPESRAALGRRLDLVGLVLATLALAAAVLPLVDGREQGWPACSWACLGTASVLVAGLALQQSSLAGRGGAPLLDPNLLRVRRFTAGLVAQLTPWCGQASLFLILALYLQTETVLPPPPPLRTGYAPEKRHGKTANEVFTDSE